VDEALEVLSGYTSGSQLEPEALNYAVDSALEDLANQLRRYTRE